MTAGTERGFSARAVGIGVAVGAAAAVSNLYVSLKTGWTLPVMTTAAMIGLAVARGQKRALHAREAVVLSSMASAAGYMAGGGNVAAIPALVMLGVAAPGPLAMAAWFATVAVLGTLTAPLLGPRIVRDLPFPTGTATAALVRAGASRAVSSALRAAALASAGAAVLLRAMRVPSTLLVPGRLGAYTFGVDTSLLLVGAGGLMTARTVGSALVGGLLTYGVLAPACVARGIIEEASYRAIVRFMVWPAASLLVTSAIVELAFEVPRLLRTRAGTTERPAGRAPYLWFVVALGGVAVVLERWLFGVPWALAVLALPAALAIAYVATRSMGETDVVPTKALAPLAQLGFGAVSPGLAAPGMAPNLTSSVALHAASTASALKTSALLRTPPREAVAASVLGCVLGSAVVVVAYGVVVPDARALPTAELPAPAVLVWKSVLEVIASGHVSPAIHVALGVGAAVGIVLAVLGRVVPRRVVAWIPSPMGLGSGMVLPFSNALAMTIGGIARVMSERKRAARPAEAVDLSVAVASGLVAGESLIAVAVQLLGGVGLRR